MIYSNVMYVVGESHCFRTVKEMEGVLWPFLLNDALVKTTLKSLIK